MRVLFIIINTLPSAIGKKCKVRNFKGAARRAYGRMLLPLNPPEKRG